MKLVFMIMLMPVAYFLQGCEQGKDGDLATDILGENVTAPNSTDVAIHQSAGFERNTDPLHQRARAKALHMLSTAQWKAYYERSQAYDNYVQWRFGKSIGKWWYGSPSLAKVKEWFLKCSAGAIETIKHGQFLFGVTKSVCSSARVAAYVWGRPSNPSARIIHMCWSMNSQSQYTEDAWAHVYIHEAMHHLPCDTYDGKHNPFNEAQAYTDVVVWLSSR